MNFIVKEENFNDIVMSNDFVTLDKPLMVEIIRKRVYPGRLTDIRMSKMSGEFVSPHLLLKFLENRVKPFLF